MVSIISVVLAAGLFGSISYRRSKRDAIQKEAIEFLDAVGGALNEALSALFRCNRNRALLPELDKAVADEKSVDSKVHRLFTLRMSVKVKSQVYFKQTEFPSSYENIMFSLSDALKKIRLSESNQSEIDKQLLAAFTEAEAALSSALAKVVGRRVDA